MPQLEVGGSHTQPRLKVEVAAVSTATWGPCLLHSPSPRGRPLAQHTNPGTRCRPLATINTRWHQPPRTALSQPRAWFNQRKELADRQGHSACPQGAAPGLQAGGIDRGPPATLLPAAASRGPSWGPLLPLFFPDCSLHLTAPHGRCMQPCCRSVVSDSLRAHGP